MLIFILISILVLASAYMVLRQSKDKGVYLSKDWRANQTTSVERFAQMWRR